MIRLAWRRIHSCRMLLPNENSHNVAGHYIMWSLGWFSCWCQSCLFSVLNLFLNWFIGVICSQIKLIMWSIWSAGEGIHYMIALQSSGSFGWTPSLLKQELVILLQCTTDTGLALYPSMTVTRMVCMQHMQVQCLTEKMGYCFTTSKIAFTGL